MIQARLLTTLALAAASGAPLAGCNAFIDVDGYRFDRAAGGAGTGGAAAGGGGAAPCGGGGTLSGDVEAACADDITVDGVLRESAWCGPWQAITKVVEGAATGASASFHARWNANYWFVGVEVEDGTLVADSADDCGGCQDDSIEIFFDMNHDQASSYGTDDFQYVLRWGGIVVWERLGQNAGASYATSATANGYSLEFQVPWTTLGKVPSTDDVYGFDIGLNDDQNGGARDRKIMWHGTAANYQDTSAFGDASLLSCP